jgi:hypothetical protein
MQAGRTPAGGEGRPEAAPVAVDGQTLIGVCWQPGHRSPTPILVHGHPERPDGRFGVPARPGDRLRGRSPTHYEWHTLGMEPGEPVVEVSRANGRRDVFRARLVGIMPTGSIMEATGPGAPSTVYGEDAFCVVEGEADTPDPYTPRWRRIVADVHADVAAGRLRAGDELPTTGQLAAMYRCSATTVGRALRHLTQTGLVVGRAGWGRFITTPTSTGEK